MVLSNEDKLLLQSEGHKVLGDTTLLQYKKKDLIELIRCLEYNWAGAIEKINNQYLLLKDLL